MISGNVWQRRGISRRILWSLAASIVINMLLWLIVDPHLSFPREAQKKESRVSAIRLEHRIVPRVQRTPRPIVHPHVRPKPRPLHPPHARRLPRPIPHVHAQPKPRLHLHKQHQRKSQESPWSGHLSFTPHQAAALTLPSGWASQDNGNAAAADTSVWMDFKKAKGAFVPQVMLWHVNAAYLSGPTLHDAVHDIVASLRSEGAEVYISKAQPVCGGKRLGWFLKYRKPNTDPPWNFDDTLYMAGDTVYRATYSRPEGVEEDQHTRAALDTLCPSPGGAG